MKARRILPLVVLAVALSLFVAGTAGATTATTSFPTVSVAGAIGFDNQGTASFASFAARAVGPALPGEDHQPARGFMTYADKTGLTFAASIQHIHGHSAVEVHFGGPITRASDPSLVGMFVHCVAIDGGVARPQRRPVLRPRDSLRRTPAWRPFARALRRSLRQGPGHVAAEYAVWPARLTRGVMGPCERICRSWA